MRLREIHIRESSVYDDLEDSDSFGDVCRLCGKTMSEYEAVNQTWCSGCNSYFCPTCHRERSGEFSNNPRFVYGLTDVKWCPLCDPLREWSEYEDLEDADEFKEFVAGHCSKCHAYSSPMTPDLEFCDKCDRPFCPFCIGRHICTRGYWNPYERSFTEEYMQVGHDLSRDVDIWWWDNGVKTQKATKRGHNVLEVPPTVAGRIDHTRKIISISARNPMDINVKRSIKQLQRKFPDYSIFDFNHSIARRVAESSEYNDLEDADRFGSGCSVCGYNTTRGIPFFCGHSRYMPQNCNNILCRNCYSELRQYREDSPAWHEGWRIENIPPEALAGGLYAQPYCPQHIQFIGESSEYDDLEDADKFGSSCQYPIPFDEICGKSGAEWLCDECGRLCCGDHIALVATVNGSENLCPTCEKKLTRSSVSDMWL